jgi:uncharacterized small protein (DUF1192 family)
MSEETKRETLKALDKLFDSEGAPTLEQRVAALEAEVKRLQWRPWLLTRTATTS